MSDVRTLAVPALLSLAVLGATTSAQAQVSRTQADGLDAPPPPRGQAPPPDGGLGIVPPPPPEADAPSVGAYPEAPVPVPSPLAAETRGLDIPSHVATRLRVLDGDLTALAARGGGHIVDGVLSMVSGAVAITLGIVFQDDISAFLYMVGGAAIARGVLNVSLVPNAQEPAVQFAHMPMRTLREVETRLVFGESTLEHLADRNRLVRLLDAGLSIGLAVAVVPAYLGTKEEDASGRLLSGPADYFVVIAAAISLLSGIITLVSHTDAERRWDAYQDLRDRLLRESRRGAVSEADLALARERAAQDARSGPTLAAGPVPGGGVGGLAWQF